MRIEQAVINASPLIALFRSRQAYLLPQLFKSIYVPEAVWQEVAHGRHRDLASQGITEEKQLIRTPATSIPKVIRLWNLGAGESAVLSLALQHPECRAVMDDQEARRCAETLNIATLGTGGVLVLAKKHGLLDSVEEAAVALRKAGLWLYDEVVSLLKQQAGE
ncbi:MAG: DUF3368 domain-containing protein [Gammaproteobacteria bacterium]|nr:DUF3368 domain-containing protein [Gammaproteobacteria bacterium]